MPLGFTSPHSSDRISAAESISYDDIGSALYFETELKDITSEAGTPVTFACKLVGDAERIVWRKDGQIMEEGDEFVQQYNSHNGWCKLTISEVFPEDQGIISCQAINKSNESVTSCFFTVQDFKSNTKSKSASAFPSLEMLPPCITKHLETVTTPPNTTVCLFVEFYSTAAADVQWFYEQKALPNSPKCTQRRGTNWAQLQLISPQEGCYSVKVTNDFGTATSIAYITVQEQWKSLEHSTESINISEMIDVEAYSSETYEKGIASMHSPYFLKKLPDKLAILNRKLHLTATVDAIPEANFAWYFENVELKCSTSCYITSWKNQSTIVLENAKHGNYKVVASNALGSCESTVTVYEDESESNRMSKFAPQFIKKLHNMSVEAGEELKLVVEVLSEPVASFKWFMDNNNVSPSTVMSADNTSELRLIPEEGKTHTFVVKAENEVGVAVNSGVVIVKPCRISKRISDDISWHSNDVYFEETEMMHLEMSGNFPYQATHKEYLDGEVDLYPLASTKSAEKVISDQKQSEYLHHEHTLMTQALFTAQPSHTDLAPKIILPLENKTASSTENITLSCKIYSAVAYAILWYHENHRLIDSEETQIVVKMMDHN
ncbi:Titin [Trichinella spiralis]|uniref:Titin n=1 Tax=Trichinella spiralis TaxID=6334 RepID=A0ABR3KXH1_TRISP